MTIKSITKFMSVSLVATTLLTGCENVKTFDWSKFGMDSQPTTQNDCPVVGISPDLGNLTQLRNDQIISETIISSIKPTCVLKDSTETVRLAIDFKGRLGPEGVKDAKNEATYSIPYLIAVVDPKGVIISKDIFAISMTYKQGQTEQSFSDLLEQAIPLKQSELPTDYKIMIGFQLTEQELAFNRALNSSDTRKDIAKDMAAPASTITANKPKGLSSSVSAPISEKTKVAKAIKK